MSQVGKGASPYAPFLIARSSSKADVRSIANQNFDISSVLS
jgi:hypothetical protein